MFDTIDGVDVLAAEVIVSEIGLDMGRGLPPIGTLLSWSCLRPRNDESAGKRRSSSIKKGSRWLKVTLIQCAWAATRMKGRYLSALYHRLRGRRGPKKAIIAVAAATLTAAYHMFKTGSPYRDLGPQHLEPRSKNAQVSRLLKRLTALGYAVELQPLVAPDPVSFLCSRAKQKLVILDVYRDTPLEICPNLEGKKLSFRAALNPLTTT
ncbi:MAG: IS110 family transposase [Hyphomicrobiaceae bacterium]|nr:IS110 family transposase [Hyphomicrobiaceae bacterium]